MEMDDADLELLGIPERHPRAPSTSTSNTTTTANNLLPSSSNRQIPPRPTHTTAQPPPPASSSYDLQTPMMTSSPPAAIVASPPQPQSMSAPPSLKPVASSAIPVVDGFVPRMTSGAVWGVVICNVDPLAAGCDPHGTCWICSKRTKEPPRQTTIDDPLFQPCNCSEPVHRSCFREWRLGWVNPRNYYSCPNCFYNYNIERIEGKSDVVSSPASKEEMLMSIRWKILFLWLSILFICGSTIALLATITWASDKPDKNIPIAIRATLVSAAYGFELNETQWRERFKDPEESVAQYYSLFASCLLAFAVLLVSACTSIGDKLREGDDDETKRPVAPKHEQRSCAEQCHCHCTFFETYWCAQMCSNPDGCGRLCSGLRCDCCRAVAGCRGDCCKCSGGGGGCGDCGKSPQIVAVIVVVVVMIVLLSAIFILIAWGVKRAAAIHDDITRMLRDQAYEIENAIIVLGKDERIRLMNEV